MNKYPKNKINNDKFRKNIQKVIENYYLLEFIQLVCLSVLIEILFLSYFCRLF